MLLAIDIGNSNISLGLFRGKRLVRSHNIPTEAARGNKYARLSMSGRVISGVSNVVVCSVVPAALKTIKARCLNLFGRPPLILGKDIKAPIKNCYRRPEQVGQDRLVNAYAGVELYGPPLIVVDFGTAITFDVISRRGEYCGGVIVPGIEISLSALSRDAALLPQIDIRPPKGLVGKDTISSMNNGVVYGFSGLVDSLLMRIKKERFRRPVTTVATGGHAKFISRYCRGIDKVDSHLILRGLRLLMEKG